jgi:hypothetical protein
MSTAEIDATLGNITAEEIEHQLAKLLESHHFCHSLRYPVLLKYLVEQTQIGNGSQLKERLLGIEVFHREPDYDTNSDPVVRVTAAEVRKRIAQYYQEPQHSGEIRIEIPTGSYLPRFSRPPAMFAGISTAPGVLESSTKAGETSTQNGHAPEQPALETGSALPGLVVSRRSTRWLALTASFCVGILLTLAMARLVSGIASRREHAVRDFWAPLTNSEKPVLVVMGDHTIGTMGNALRSAQGAAVSPSEDVLQLMNEHEQVTIDDTISLFKITEYMVRHTQSYTATGAGSASIDNLRNGPVLLFAGLDNRWTMRLIRPLRYRFVDSPDDTIGIIEDTQAPGRHWQVDFKVPADKMTQDYAIVARYFDPLIEQPVIVAAGVGATGTASASEFVTSERQMEDMEKLAPKGWQHGNLEVVLETPVIDGHPGPPHVIASHFW